MSNDSPNTPEERDGLTRMCNDLTDSILHGTNGMPIGPVLGACMNVIRTAATYLPAAERGMLAARLRNDFAPDILAMRDGASEDQPQPEPGSGFAGPLGISDEEYKARVDALAKVLMAAVPPTEHVVVVQAAALSLIHMGIAGMVGAEQAALMEGAEQALVLYRSGYNIPRPVKH